ncbi:hypothetical protein AMTR_s00029p00103510 [Amborella trichopoda]|uniref:Uncharacterized protein n=1 Tax=Amborella trichopoda TaxID=13333 RepID=W1PQH6_AMBTC|nr:hypothetical protein AMTR_s00029p00103510 [Amborella trichopoda]
MATAFYIDHAKSASIRWPSRYKNVTKGFMPCSFIVRAERVRSILLWLRMLEPRRVGKLNSVDRKVKWAKSSS